MIVNTFLRWVQTAPAADRAEATTQLARAYLISDVSPHDLAAIEAAMVVMLDDRSPLVREALANVLARSSEAPHHVILALAADQPDVAEPVLRDSPVLTDADLIELIGTGDAERQAAIAARERLSPGIAAAIAEVGTASACLVLVENGAAPLTRSVFERLVQRFGHLSVLREALLARPDLPPEARLGLVQSLADTLGRFVAAKAWLGEERVERVVRDAAERAAVTLAFDLGGAAMPDLVTRLKRQGKLTPALLLRAVLTGQIDLFEAALADLSGLPIAKVRAVVADPGSPGFRAVFGRAGLPEGAFASFRAALLAGRETGFALEADGEIRLRRAMVDEALRVQEQLAGDDVDQILTLLRRLASEAAREEARAYTRELIAA